MELPNDALVNFVLPNDMVVLWKLTMVLFPYFTGLIGGAFVVSGLYHVLGIKQFKPIANFSLIAAFCFGLFAGTPILLHLGQPQRAFEIYFTPHATSAMSGFGYLYSGFLILLAIEIWLIYRPYFIRRANETKGPQRAIWTVLTLGVTTYHPTSAGIDRKVTFFLACLGIPWAFLLIGYEGFMFGSVKAIAWWATALQPVIFLSSAIVSGMAMLVVLYTFVKWRSRAPYDYGMIKSLSAILWAFFILDWTLEVLELVHVSYQNGHEWTVIKPLILGPLSGSFIYGQMIFLSLVPTVLLAYAALSGDKGRKMLYLANLGSFLLLLQVLFMRFNVVIGGQLMSKSERGFAEFDWELFGREGILAVAMVFAAPFVAYYVISRYIPVFEGPDLRATHHGDTAAQE